MVCCCITAYRKKPLIYKVRPTKASVYTTNVSDRLLGVTLQHCSSNDDNINNNNKKGNINSNNYMHSDNNYSYNDEKVDNYNNNDNKVNNNHDNEVCHRHDIKLMIEILLIITSAIMI